MGVASGVLSQSEEKVFESMLQVDVIRGKDSTGVAIIKKAGYTVVKKVGAPQELLDSHRYVNNMKGANSILIGHNRWATIGKTNSSNAHPFDVGDLVGVHNGTLENKYDIDKGALYETDSEALYAHIKAHGVANTISKVRGAWALVWWDEEEATLNFLRNKERPLCMAFSDDETTMYWASESWMIWAMCAREGVKISKTVELPIDTHIKYEIPALGNLPIKELSRMDVKGAVPFIRKGATTVAGNSTTTSNSTETRMKGLIGKQFKAKAGLIIYDKTSTYIRYLAEGHYMDEFRVYFPNAEAASEHANKEAVIQAKYMVAANGWPKYLSCEVVYPDVEDEEVVKPITREDFEKRHKDCAWCGEQLDYNDDWFVSSAGVAVCSQCTKNDDVKTYLNIQ